MRTVLLFRGPWTDTWKELRGYSREEVTLTHNREVVESKL